jgi:sugar O-acyltransferase (sialic acid O-acetyltransferase NeuD family)
MIKIILVGSGGLAADLTLLFENKPSDNNNNLSIVGYIDYDYNIEKYWKRYHFDKPVLGDIDSCEIKEDEYFIIAIADVDFRKKMIDKLKQRGAKLINLIHPTSMVAKDLDMGEGNIIGPYCMIGHNTKMGNHNLLLAHSTIGHDCVIGDNNIFTASLITGHVKLQNDNYFGARSTVIPKLTLGNRNTIQAGMVLDKNINNDTVVFHRFKEKIMAISK